MKGKFEHELGWFEELYNDEEIKEFEEEKENKTQTKDQEGDNKGKKNEEKSTFKTSDTIISKILIKDFQDFIQV